MNPSQDERIKDLCAQILKADTVDSDVREVARYVLDCLAPSPSTLGQDTDLIAEIEKRPGAAYLMDRLRSYGHNTRKDRNKTLCELMLNAADEIERLLKSRQPHVTLTPEEREVLSDVYDLARGAHGLELRKERVLAAYPGILDRLYLAKAEAP